MLRVGEAVQETDGDGFDLLRSKYFDRAFDARLVQRLQDLALCVDALADRQPQAAGNQRRWQIDIDVVLLEAVFVTDLDDVAETLRGQKRGLGALAFDQRVGGKRRAVDDQFHLPRLDAGFGDHRAHGGKHALFRPARGGQRLGGKAPAADLQRHVGKRAADIDAEPGL